MNMIDVFTLRGPRVLVRQLAAISATASGLILADNQTTEMHHRGIVERVGPGELLESGARRPVQDIKAGDLVYYARFAGSQLTLSGQSRLVLMEDEIQGAITAENLPSLVLHTEDAPDGSFDHFDGEPCSVCIEQEAAARRAAADAAQAIQDEAARARLAEERAALQQAKG